MNMPTFEPARAYLQTGSPEHRVRDSLSRDMRLIYQTAWRYAPVIQNFSDADELTGGQLKLYQPCGRRLRHQHWLALAQIESGRFSQQQLRQRFQRQRRRPQQTVELAPGFAPAQTF